MAHIVIDGNAFYEIDDECIERKKREERRKAEARKKAEAEWKRENTKKENSNQASEHQINNPGKRTF